MSLSRNFRGQAIRFVRAALENIRKTCDPRDLPTSLAVEGKRTPQGRLRIIQRPTPNWYQLPLATRNQLHALPTFSTLRNAASAEPDVKKVVGHNVTIDVRGIRYDSAGDLAWAIVGDYLDGLRTPVFNTHRLNRRLDALEEFLSFPADVTIRVVAPLEGFEMRGRRITLGNGLRIVRLEDRKLVETINRLPSLTTHFGSALHPWFRYVLVFEERVPKKLDEPIPSGSLSNVAAALVNQEILMLRSFTLLQPFARTFVYDYRGWPAAFSSGGVIADLPWHGRSVPISNSLTTGQIATYKDLRARALGIQDRTSAGRIATAMRRLAFAFERPYAGDRLTDAVTGLEALFLDAAGELQHRLTQRVACFLASDETRRAEIILDVETAYKRRSHVVHGEIVPDHFGFSSLPLRIGTTDGLTSKEIKKFNEIQKLAPKVAQYLKLSIQGFVKRGSVLAEEEWKRAFMKGPRVG